MVETFQTFMVPSREVVNTLFPPRLPHSVTAALCPCSFASRAPVRTSHTHTLPSHPPEKICCPLPSTSRDVTPPAPCARPFRSANLLVAVLVKRPSTLQAFIARDNESASGKMRNGDRKDTLNTLYDAHISRTNMILAECQGRVRL
jgi:hypothetical protein